MCRERSRYGLPFDAAVHGPLRQRKRPSVFSRATVTAYRSFIRVTVARTVVSSAIEPTDEIGSAGGQFSSLMGSGDSPGIVGAAS